MDSKDSKIKLLQDKIYDIRSDMISNIDRLMNRSENLETITSKSENLLYSAKNFKSNTNTYKYDKYKNNIKFAILTTIIILIGSIIIWGIVKMIKK